jgi:hypothetical protein
MKLRWDHTGGGPFCSGQGAGFCTLAWESFRGNLFTPKATWDKACIYDNYCNPICNEMQQVPGYQLRYDTIVFPPPLYFASTHIGPWVASSQSTGMMWLVVETI